MYCGFCGKKLLYNAKYCRCCGHQLTASLEDTEPVPIISDSMLYSSMRQTPAPWYKPLFARRTLIKKTRIWKLLCDFSAIAVLTVLLYILVSFKTIWEYQTLTTLWGGGLLIYIWRKR